MIPFPYSRALLTRRQVDGGGAGSMSYFDSTVLLESDSDSSLSRTSPASILDGDILLAVLMTNNMSITTPSGWTQVLQEPYSSSGLTRYMTIFSKDTVTSSDSSQSFSFSQGSAARIAIGLIVVRSSTGSASIVESSSTSNDNGSYSSISPPVLTSTGDEIFICTYASMTESSAFLGYPTQPTGMTRPQSPVERLSWAYQLRSSGQSNSGSFDIGGGGTVTSNAAATFRIAPV